MIDAFVTQVHYATHLAPIWFALPAEERGTWWAAGACADRGNEQGVPGWRRGYPPAGERPVMVGGYMDEQPLMSPIIYVEHGAGQTYLGVDNESYSGSSGHDRVVLFLSPGETVARRWRERYPSVPAIAVGCPKLDWWHSHPGAGGGGPQPTLAIAFHSENRLCPETRNVWDHYENGLPAAVADLRTAGWEILGHGHPRLWGALRTFWGWLNVEPVEDFNEILRRADVLAVDNSSVGPEFASTGRPIIWMNQPSYRRDVHHGGRFWDWTVGIPTVDGPNRLAPSAIDALVPHPVDWAGARARQAMVSSIYVACDGHAAERAAAAILAATGGSNL